VDLFEDSGMRGLSKKLGLRYVGFPRDDDYVAETGGLPNLPLLADGDAQDVTDLMYGRLGSSTGQVFNLRVGAYDADPRHVERSCVAITFAAAFPKLLIGPHTHMSRLRQRTAWKSMRNLPDGFKDRFSIEAPDPEGVARVLGPDLAGWLGRQRPDLRLELQGGALLVHVPHLDEDEFTQLTDLAQGVHLRIHEEAWAEYSLFKLT
jgi:hypothetical protein